MNDPFALLGDGHTALSEEDSRGLIPSYISTRQELFEAEQRNIAQALLRRAPATAVLLDDQYLRDLHRAMLGEVWSWAGRYRQGDTNIGIDWRQIPGEVRNLVLNAQAWVEHDAYEADEIAIRFHHRLVQIHPFPNGNGRHSRIASDLLARALGRRAFSWGANLEATTADLRAAYIQALRAADDGDLGDLVRFAHS